MFGMLGRITEIGFSRHFLYVFLAYRLTILGTQYLIIDQPDNLLRQYPVLKEIIEKLKRGQLDLFGED